MLEDQTNTPGFSADDGSGEDWDRCRERTEPSALLFFPYVRIEGVIIAAGTKTRKNKEKSE